MTEASDRINELIDEVLVVDLVEELRLHDAGLPPFVREVWLPMAESWLTKTDPRSSR